MNKQELKEAIGELNLVDTVFESDGVSYIDTAVSVMQVYDLIEQLDEPEVLSQEVPVIPEFVADWIKEIKPAKSLRVAFEYIAQRKADNHDDPLAFWIEEGNSETFARAWLGGFHVEVEPLYYALIKGHELITDEGDFTCKYWNLWVSEGCVFPYDKSPHYDDFSIIMTKSEWGKWGINDSNADFVEVDEELN